MVERTHVTTPDADQSTGTEITTAQTAGAKIEAEATEIRETDHDGTSDDTRLEAIASESSPEANPAARELAILIAQAADDRKAENIRILDVSGVSYLADYFVIASGFSKVQVRAIARSVDAAVKESYQRDPIRTEGIGEGQWVLYDYGEVIVHIFMPREREFYDLEAFWGHAQEIPFEPSPAPAPSQYFGGER